MATKWVEDRRVLVNLEINNRCQLTNICGENCILNTIASSIPSAQAMKPEQVLEAAFEVIENGQNVGPLALVGKEVLESPDVLFAILERYHSTPVEIRPQSIQIITSGAQLRRHIDRFAELPLHGCFVSLDADPTGLHLPEQNRQLLTDLLCLKERGGTNMSGVISVLDNTNTDALLELGAWVCSQGSLLDQWSIGQKLIEKNRKMVPGVSQAIVQRTFDHVVTELGGEGQSNINQILFELEYPTFNELFGETIPPNSWRKACQIPGTNVWAVAQNANPGHFIRLRWDGQLISKQDLRQLGTVTGAHGRYRPGKLRSFLEGMSCSL